MIEKTAVHFLDTLPYTFTGRAVALGLFDGIHQGHINIIKKMVRTATLDGLTSCVQTFINFDKAGTGLLTTIEEKREILSALGVEELLVLDFKAIKDMSPDQFCEDILKMRVGAVSLFAGEDYRFGARAAGNIETLKEFAAANSYDIEVFDDMLFGDSNRRMSSTWLREALAEGNVSLVREMCGYRPFAYSGIVVEGNKLGRKMGFPTANIIVPEDKFVVRRGVYASRIMLGSNKLYGITNIGLRPTVGDLTNDVVETYIFDFDDDIYGARIKVELLDFIRPEKKFNSLDDLMAEVEANKVQAKTFFANEGIIIA